MSEAFPLRAAGLVLGLLALSLHAAPAGADTLCVENLEQLDAALFVAFHAPDTHDVIRIVHGEYDMRKSYWANHEPIPDADGVVDFYATYLAQQPYVVDNDLTLSCGWRPQCEKQYNLPRSVLKFDQGTDHGNGKTSIRVDEGKLRIENCSFRAAGWSLELVHGEAGEDWSSPNSPTIELQDNIVTGTGNADVGALVRIVEGYNSVPTIDLVQNVFARNAGLGCGLTVGDYGSDGTIRLMHNTVSDNTCGVELDTKSIVAVENNIFHGNFQNDLRSESAWLAAINNVIGLSTLGRTPLVWLGNSPYSPQFQGSLDYHIGPGSAARDLGLPIGAFLDLPEHDLAGLQRTVAGRPDAGAYEYPGFELIPWLPPDRNGE